MRNAIEVQGLEKSYGSVQAVRGIDLAVAEGQTVAFLGHNGAGKTTVIEILEGFRKRDSGNVSVLGQDPAEAPQSWRENIGIVLQESEPIPELTVQEAITLQSSYYSNPRRPEEVLELVGLQEAAKQRTRKLSGGQKRRLDLGLALVGNPEVIFLDEPTTGFDPSARRDAWQMIDSLHDLGSTVLLTTHYMDEAEHLAQNIIVIANGTLVAEGTPKELAKQAELQATISWTQTSPEEPPTRLKLITKTSTTRYEVETTNELQDMHEITSWALEKKIEIENLQLSQPTLEDVYLKLSNIKGNE